MKTYKRKITYFYQYYNGTVGSTVGFLKLEIRGERVKVIINIQDGAGQSYDTASLYFYHEAGDHLAALKVDEIKNVEGVLTYHTRLDWQNFYQTGRDLYTFDGALGVYNGNHYYVGDFTDKDRHNVPIQFLEVEKKEPKQTPVNSGKRELEKKEIKEIQEETIKKESADEFFQCENCPYQEKRKELKKDADSLQEMLDAYPKIPVYGATELFQCVRIHPKDIGKLDMKNWKLGVNSFLTHGYFTYQYLLLGKMRFPDGMERPIIGVPGVYTNREKYLANMFGFEQFIPVQKTGIKTGEFGYWIIEIS